MEKAKRISQGSVENGVVRNSNPENMPELHVVNYGHSTPCTNCWRLRCLDLRMINCNLSARGLAEIDKQTNVGAWSCLIPGGRFSPLLCDPSRQISSYLSYLPWLSNVTIWTVVIRTTTPFNGFSVPVLLLFAIWIKFPPSPNLGTIIAASIIAMLQLCSQRVNISHSLLTHSLE